MKTIIIVAIALGFSFVIQQGTKQLNSIASEIQSEQFFNKELGLSKHIFRNQMMVSPSEHAKEKFFPIFFSIIQRMIVPLAGVTILMWFFLSLGFFKSFKSSL